MALRPSDIPPETVAELNRGQRETANLAEQLAMDQLALLETVAPAALPAARTLIEPGDKITRLTAKLGLAIHRSLKDHELDRLAKHPADIPRAWACYAICAIPDLAFADRLGRLQPLADDHHFGVREWVWMALRPRLIESLDEALTLLEPWARDASPNIRRFASEATRPRGVWCAHIRALRDNPRPALPLLEPLRCDPDKYVQDSAANWLNDAAKDHPSWVIEVTDRWMTESPTPQTARIVKRARRSLLAGSQPITPPISQP